MLKIIDGYDGNAWTSIFVALVLPTLAAAFGYYLWSLYRQYKCPGGIDWDRPFGIEPNLPKTSDPVRSLDSRLQFGGMGALSIFLGARTLYSGNRSGDALVLIAGGVLFVAGLLLALVALFPNSKFMNKRYGSARQRQDL